MTSTDTGAARAWQWVLADNQLLRFCSFFLLYACQGVPVGLSLVAVPAWMASSGKSAGEIAAVTSTALLPWGVKMFNGLIMDRYPYLPMGRRRAWLVGAQLLVCLALAGLIVMQPGIEDLGVITALLFAMNLAVTFQDAAIDGISVDITPPEERGRVNGFMAAGQVIGAAASGAIAGFLLPRYGLSGAAMPLLAYVALIALLVVVVLERAGERRLPWTRGKPAAYNAGAPAMGWAPLLGQVLRALLQRNVFILMLAFGCYGFAAAINDIAVPVYAAQELGWSVEKTSGLQSTANLVAGLTGLFVLGFLADRLGAAVMAIGGFLGAAMAAFIFTVAASQVAPGPLFTAFIIAFAIAGSAMFIGNCALAMRVCRPEIAASQFALMVAVPNIVRLGVQNTVQPLLDGGGFALAWLTITAAGVTGAVLYWTAYRLTTGMTKDRLKNM